MISDEEIDEALLANVIHRWRKVAGVVGSAMSQLGDKRRGRDDLYFAQRVSSLVQRGSSKQTVTLIRWDGVKLGCLVARMTPNQPLEPIVNLHVNPRLFPRAAQRHPH